MYFKRFSNGNIEEVKKDGYLTIDGEEHLILNIQNQPIDILNSNGIYQFIDAEEPEYIEGSYWKKIYVLENNIIYAKYEQRKRIKVEVDEYGENTEN